MNDRLGDRAASVSSSVTEAEAFDDNEKKGSHDGSFVKVKAPEEMEMGSDLERAELLAAPVQAEKAAEAPSSNKAAVIWMVVNTLATIGIVRESFQKQIDNLQFCIFADISLFLGLHQQSYLLGPFPQTRTTYICVFPFLHHMAYAFHSLETSICDVRAPPRGH